MSSQRSPGLLCTVLPDGMEHLQRRAEIGALGHVRSVFKRNLHGPRPEFIAGSILDRRLMRPAEGTATVCHPTEFHRAVEQTAV